MNIMNNIGISFSGDYIRQGSNTDKIKLSKDLNTNFLEIKLKTDNINFNDFSINNNIIYNLPTLNNNLTNLHLVKNIILNLKKYGAKTFTIDASSLLLEIYEFSTLEEQQNYLKNIASGFSDLITNDIVLLIENTKTYKGEEYLGNSVKDLKDILTYTKELLNNHYNYSFEKIDSSIGISLNLNRINKEDYNNFINVFKGDIKLIKIPNNFEKIDDYKNIFDLITNNNLNVPILFQTQSDIEDVVNEYRKIVFLLNKNINNETLDLNDFKNIKVTNDLKISPSQSGFTNFIVISMIILTIIIAVMMFKLKLS